MMVASSARFIASVAVVYQCRARSSTSGAQSASAASRASMCTSKAANSCALKRRAVAPPGRGWRSCVRAQSSTGMKL